jgi:hypothetical protein
VPVIGEKSGFLGRVISITHLLKGMLMKREKAFTVIKLPVAAVMSLLLSQVVPSLRRVKRQAADAINLPLYPTPCLYPAILFVRT